MRGIDYCESKNEYSGKNNLGEKGLHSKNFSLPLCLVPHLTGDSPMGLIMTHTQRKKFERV
jgi:hypothetical protein